MTTLTDVLTAGPVRRWVNKKLRAIGLSPKTAWPVMLGVGALAVQAVVQGGWDSEMTHELLALAGLGAVAHRAHPVGGSETTQHALHERYGPT